MDRFFLLLCLILLGLVSLRMTVISEGITKLSRQIEQTDCAYEGEVL